MIPSTAKTEIMDAMQQIKILMKDVTYEHVMNKAYKLDKHIRRPSKQEYINLFQAELGIPATIKASFDRQLLEIKSQLIQAMHIFISKTSDDAAIAIFKNLEVQVSTAQSSADINEILKMSLDATTNFK